MSLDSLISRPVRALIGLGSNLGDPMDNVRRAWRTLVRRPQIQGVALSSPYRTEPVAMVTDNWFVNAAGVLATRLPPAALLEQLLDVERALGRVRAAGAVGYQDRVIDLDLLLYDTWIVRRPNLRVPHPAMAHRRFVLAPAVEIAPDMRHPGLGLSLAEVLAELESGPDAAAGRCRRLEWPEGDGWD